MTNDPRSDVESLARAVAAGQAVDWDHEEATAADEATRRLVRELRVVAAVRDLHASPAANGSPGLAEPATTSSAGPLHAGSHPTWCGLALLERIAHGSYGDVYRAWDPRLDREVALKLLQAPALPGAARDHTIEEARLLARVRHPNVVTIHGADRDDGQVGLWMEFIRGRTLEAMVGADGPRPAREAAFIGIDVCRALAAVHAAGLLHRDVKAQNVMVEDGGRVVLMDFGASIEPGGGPNPHGLAGTPLYLAPEVLAGDPGTERSDVYSIGVLLYYLTTASYPFVGRDLEDVRDAHRRGRRVGLLEARPDVPREFANIVDCALATDPDGRFGGAAALGAALATWLESQGGRRASTSPPHRSRRALVAIAALAALGLAIVALTFDSTGLRSRVAGAPSPEADGAALPVNGLQLRQLDLPQVMHWGPPSPNGRHLPAVDLEGNLALVDVASRQVLSLTARRGLNEFAEPRPAVSHDGRSIAYTWATGDGRHELRVIDAGGGESRTLLRRDEVEFPGVLGWSRDGQQILVALEMTDGSTLLALVHTGSGAVHPIRRCALPQSATLAPDDRFVAFDEPAGDDGRAFVRVVRVADGLETARIEHPGHDTLPVWTAEGELVFASDRTGSMGLWRVRTREGRLVEEPRLLHRDIGRYFPLGVTRSGTLYFMLQTGMVDVYTADADFASTALVAQPKQVAPTAVGNNMSSGWSNDGRRLAYVASRGLSYRVSKALVIRDVDTGTERILRPPLAHMIAPLWSRDDTRILVSGTDLQNRMGGFIVEVASGRTVSIFDREAWTDDAAKARDVRAGTAVPQGVGGEHVGSLRWSPDGRAVVYNRPQVGLISRDVVTGRENVLVDYRAEGVITLEWNPGAFRFSPDGQALAFVAFPRGGPETTMVLRVKGMEQGARSRELLRSATESLALQPWSPDGREVLVTRRERRRGGPPAALWRVPIDGSSPIPTGFSMPGLRYIESTSDGRRLTFTAGMPLTEPWSLEGFARPATARPASQ